jgi:hypothetical protein
VGLPLQAARAGRLRLGAGTQGRHAEHERGSRHSQKYPPHEPLLLDCDENNDGTKHGNFTAFGDAVADLGGNIRSRPNGKGLANRPLQQRLDKQEQNGNNNTSMRFGSGEPIMLRTVLEETLALASITLFLATIAVWAQVLV